MIRILITEDSDVVSLLLKMIFEGEPDMQVIGRAENGRKAVELAHALKPDLITMDIRMPVMDGFEATRLIMSSAAVPIVVISSSLDDEELRITFRAIEAGALAVLEKPVGLNHPEFEAMRQVLIDTVRSVAKVNVSQLISPVRRKNLSIPETTVHQREKAHEIIAIGCSTGGPQALLTLLSRLPIDFPIPIVIAQHISKGFIGGLVVWLQENTSLRVKLAEEEEVLLAGTVYFAPDNFHLMVNRGHDGLIAELNADAEVNGFRPSATRLLKSVAETCEGHGVGVLLTGMGSDGAEGLLAMRKAGSWTMVQDESSAIVYGMPGAAIALNAVDQVVQLESMSSYLLRLVRK